MPKDKHSLASDTGKNISEPKKKVVVVEEVETEEPQTKVEEVSEEKPKAKEELKIETKQVQEIAEDDEEEKPNYLWIIVPTALLVGALVGGLITYFSGVSNMSDATSTPTPLATQVPTETKVVEPTASPSVSLKRDSLKVQVLNGSGVSGVAGKVKTELEKLGYKNVTAGNASSSDFTTTEVAIKTSKKEYLDMIIKDLSEDYEAEEADKSLPASSSYDVVITVGKQSLAR
jgi:hypothetical protein